MEQHKDKEEKQPVVEEIDVEKEFVNENFLKVTSSGNSDLIEVSGVSDALDQLVMNEFDKHPEKRMRAAWEQFFEEKLPEYKKEYPNAKRSQLTEFMQKEWKKSPMNPVYRQQVLLSQKVEQGN